MFRVEPQVYLLAALLLLLLPLRWLLAAVFSAVFHELCHILVLLLLKGRIYRIRIGWNGCVIEGDSLGQLQQFFSILAGPMGSLLLVGLCRVAPRIAICGFIQGLYNLLPLMPLDGGRLLQILLYRFCPGKASALIRGIGISLRICITAVILYLAASLPWSMLLVLIPAIWNMQGSCEKFLANRQKTGYNSFNFFYEVIL